MRRRSRYPAGVEGTEQERLYNIWRKMLYRCRNPRSDSYKNYGAKGVRVCEEWSRFAPFRDWALANGYAPTLTIERRDGRGHYEPGNCTWATRLEQNQNRLTVHRAPTGEAYCEIARKNGIGQKTFASRLALGWPLDLASTAPTARHAPPLKYLQGLIERGRLEGIAEAIAASGGLLVLSDDGKVYLREAA